MLNGHPGGSVYKGAVRMARAGEGQGIQDRLTEIALDFSMLESKPMVGGAVLAKLIALVKFSS